jgi:SSS family solute:Na+ symporter
MWPATFGATFTAKSGDTLRRNAVVMPLYTITLAFIFFVGFTAVMVVPGLTDGDLALLTVVRGSFSSWLLGVVGGAGALTAMVPASILILTAATLFAKNLWRPIFAPAMTDGQLAKLARAMVVVLSVISLYLATHSSATLVFLLLLGYAGVTQFFPGVVLGLYWKRVTTAGVFAGIIAGIGIAAFLILTHQDPIFGWNAGFVGLCVNVLITAILSLVKQANSAARANPVGSQVAPGRRRIRSWPQVIAATMISAGRNGTMHGRSGSLLRSSKKASDLIDRRRICRPLIALKIPPEERNTHLPESSSARPLWEW